MSALTFMPSQSLLYHRAMVSADINYRRDGGCGSVWINMEDRVHSALTYTMSQNAVNSFTTPKVTS